MKTRDVKNELKNLSLEELISRFNGLKQELFRLRFDAAKGQLQNSSLFKTTKKNVARIQTIIMQYRREALSR